MSIPPPLPREHKPRLTRALMETQPGENHLVSKAVAYSLRAYIQRRGGKVVQRQEGAKIRIWRLS